MTVMIVVVVADYKLDLIVGVVYYPFFATYFAGTTLVDSVPVA